MSRHLRYEIGKKATELLKKLDAVELVDTFTTLIATMPRNELGFESEVISEVIARLMKPEAQYHQMRRMFYIDDSRVHYAELGVEETHKEWMRSHITGMGQWHQFARGYAMIDNIYFYVGEDHRGGDYVERMARANCVAIAKKVGLVNPLIHVGVEPGNPGDVWEPLDTLGRLLEL